MLRLPPFELRRPGSLAEAAAILAGEGAAEGRARPVAGGTDLWPNMKRRHQTAEVVVALSGLRELHGVHANGELRIGAATTLTEAASHPALRERYPALARAIESISSPPLRNMGTIGGNVCVDTRCTYYNQTEEWRRSIDYCMKEAGEVCWVAPSSPRCWAHSASDSAPMLAALSARVRLVSAEGERTVPLPALYRDDGIEYLEKRPDEIVAEVLVPADWARTGGEGAAGGPAVRTAFWKLRRRGSIDFAVLAVAAAVKTGADGAVADARIVLGAVSSRPVAADQAAAALIGKPLTAESIAEAAKLARRPATPMDNTDFQAQWRGAVVPKYVEAALRECAGLPVERLAPNHLA
ncbi:MAG TPA: FAD binding domain-containing protein [Thermoanaerobaculia bacterium]|nr:FAD binding domain-containing protein [Thermoanaerobaculia bacterium]